MTRRYKTRRSINKFGVAEWNLSITVRYEVKKKGEGCQGKVEMSGYDVVASIGFFCSPRML